MFGVVQWPIEIEVLYVWHCQFLAARLIRCFWLMRLPTERGSGPGLCEVKGQIFHTYASHIHGCALRE